MNNNEINSNVNTKFKYWICDNNYMELNKEEMNLFLSSCILHQI